MRKNGVRLMIVVSCAAVLAAGCGKRVDEKEAEGMLAQTSAAEAQAAETQRHIVMEGAGAGNNGAGAKNEGAGAGQTGAGAGNSGAGAQDGEAGTGQVETGGQGTDAGAKSEGARPSEFSMDQVIGDQSFDVDLDGWGEVKFVSVAPDGEKTKDVSFYLMKDDQVIYQFPETGSPDFQSVVAVSFQDFNRDGKKDVLTLTGRKSENGQSYQTCTVYLQENDAAPDCMEAKLLAPYLVTGKSDMGPAFSRDTFLEEYLSKNQKTDTIKNVMASYEDYMRYVRGLCLAEELPGLPFHFSFYSGAGAWNTALTLYPDGSFDGLHNDSDMGDAGEGYPDGTRYTCVFQGSFGQIVKLNDYSYSLTLESLVSENKPGEKWLEDNVRYIASEAYGIEGGKEFILYTPQTPLGELSEEFLSWKQYSTEDGADTEKLGCYGLLNVEMGYGFFAY